MFFNESNSKVGQSPSAALHAGILIFPASLATVAAPL